MKKKFSRMLALLLTAAMLIAGVGIIPAKEAKAASKPGFTISTDKSEIKPGDTFTANFYVEKDANFNMFAGLITYDAEKLDLISVVPPYDVVLNANIIYDRPTDTGFTPGSVALVLEYGTVITSKLQILTLTFKVKNDAAGAGTIGFDFGGAMNGDTTVVSEGNDNINFVVDGPNGVFENGSIPITIELQSLAFDKKELTMARGTEDKLTLNATPANALVGKTVVWESSDEEVVTVDQEGNLKAVGTGEATVTASVDGKEASALITVNAPLETINITAENITGNTASVMKGKTLQLKAELVPEDASVDVDSMVWESDEPEVATVDQNGLVTAVENGTATITAAIGEVTGTFTITVETVPLTSISIKENTTIHRGETETLAVTYEPENTTDDRTVTWSTSDPEIATVDQNGTVKAVGVGSAKITAKADNDKIMAFCTVTVDAPLEQIVPDQTVLELVKGQKSTIKYTLDPEDTTDDKSVSFKSSEPEVARVDETTGEVTALKEGTATITLTGARNVSATVEVQVTEIPIEGIVLNQKNATVEKGETTTLTASVYPEETTDNKTIKWSSSDPSVATVSKEMTQAGDNVTVTATDKGGTATITAEAWNGKKAYCEIFVPVHLEKIVLPGSVSLKKGDTDMLAFTCTPAQHDDQIVAEKWSTKDEAVASVDNSGMVTGRKEGTATIWVEVTVRSSNGQDKILEASTEVQVTEKHLDEHLGDTIDFEKMEDPLLKNQSVDMEEFLNLTDILDKNEITDTITVAWSSSDEDIAAIDQTGLLTGRKAGKTTVTAVITAMNGAGETVGTYTVTTEVTIKEIPLESITFDKIIKEMVEGTTETLHIIYNPENTTDTREAEWSSSDETVLTVDNGKVTALKPGTATVTAKVGDQEVSCEILVKAAPAGQQNPGQSGVNGTGTAGTSSQGTVGNADTAVRTGDSAHTALYIVMLLAALAAVVLIWRRRNTVR